MTQMRFMFAPIVPIVYFQLSIVHCLSSHAIAATIAANMMSVETSNLAALAAGLLWAGSAIAWGFAGRRIGSVAVTAIRSALAVAILLPVYWLLMGHPMPTHLAGQPFWLLMVSGALGVGLADICGFRGLLLLGPRVATLMSSLITPILTAVVAFAAVGEKLTVWALAGIVLTVAGVAWVVSDPHGQKAWPVHQRHFKQGVMLCLASAFFMSFSNVLTRMAFDGQLRTRYFSHAQPDADPFSASFLRVLAGGAVIWLALPLLGRVRAAVTGFANKKAMLIITAGTIVGPVVGIWMSMVAFSGTKSGIAAALINTSPIFMIPIAYFAYGEKPTFRSLAGTAAAMAGVFMLLLKAA
jgi:drug/metabolite transporter (DMT)-like permease